MRGKHFQGPIASAALLLTGFWVCGSPAPVHGATGPRLAFVQAPAADNGPAGAAVERTILASMYRSDMRIVLADVADVVGTRRVITTGFHCATDPAFRHDARKLAFAGVQHVGDCLQLWEVDVDMENPAPVRLAGGDADGVQPAYLPDGGVVFASLQAHEYEEHGGRFSFSLFATSYTQDQPTRLTFNPSSDFDPVVLPDGRVCYSSWQHVGNHRWPRGGVALMLINADGTGVFPLTGNHRDPWLRRGTTALTGTDRLAFIQADRLDGFGAGTLVAVSINDPFGPHETLVDPHEFSVAAVAPLPDGTMVISARPADGSRATFGLYVLDGDTVSLLYDDPTHHDLAPATAFEHAPPERRISTVVPDTPFGYLLVLNSYETDRPTRRPLDASVAPIVRVIEGRPLRYDGHTGPEFLSVPGREDEPLVSASSATGYIPSRILGEVPLADDGSMYLKVPADRPLRLQLIDREGFAVMNERAWFWVRPNERRVCIGCHENRELAPDNRAPMAARREPTDLTRAAQWQEVNFREHVQPILAANCAVAGCHVPPRPTAGMNLTAGRLNGTGDAPLANRFGPAYANLLARQEHKSFSVGGRRVHPGDSRSSPMLWMLYGRALAPQYRPAPFDRPIIAPHPGPMLPEAQLSLIRRWIDLGACYDQPAPAGPWPHPILRAEVAEASPHAK